MSANPTIEEDEQEHSAAEEWAVEGEEEVEPSSKGVLSELAAECAERTQAAQEGKNVNPWVEIDPPTPKQEEESPSIIGNYNGKPVKTGFVVKDMTEEAQEDLPTVVTQRKFRTSKYDVYFRVREEEYYGDTEFSHVGVTDENGELTVTIPEKTEAAGRLRVVAQHEPHDDSARIREGWFTSDDAEINAGQDLTIQVEGNIAADEEVTLTVVDEDGAPVPGTDVHMEGPVKLAVGEVYVEEVSGYDKKDDSDEE